MRRGHGAPGLEKLVVNAQADMQEPGDTRYDEEEKSCTLCVCVCVGGGEGVTS